VLEYVPFARKGCVVTWCEENDKRGLLKEYVDPDKGPTEVTRASGYRALWKCAACDHEWRTRVSQRTLSDRPSGCPACRPTGLNWGPSNTATPTNNFLVWCKENGERGEILLEEYVDPDRKPTEVMRGSQYKALWKCATCGHEWRALLNNRTKRIAPNGCPACSKRLPKTEAHFFLEWCEENGERGERLSREYADPDRKPTELAYGSDYKALWKCAECDHGWRASVLSRTSRANGCPACSGHAASSRNNFRVWCEENGERGKKLLEEYVDPDRKPTEVMRGSSYKALWKCATCEHEWRAKMHYRTRANNPAGCPSCSVYAARSTFQAWCDANGERGKKLLEEYVDADRGPTDVARASHYKALWKCAECDHEWRAMVFNRTSNRGCPKCNRGGGPRKVKSARRVPPAATS
jgi:DNA-directed RNA polymerase subunit RPC12/RpoP